MTDLWDRFEAPPRAFSPVPLWWWSGETVTAERLRWQLERLVAGGVFNVVVMNVAPTSPLYGKDADDPPFMSEPWWQLFDGVCRDAEALGVSLWFYDQIGFSGANFQGQVVQRHPEHAGRWLERETVAGEGELTLECPAGGTPVGAAALTENGEIVPVVLDGRTARFSGPGRLMLFHAVERGFDYYSAPACRRLFDMVHGRFEERVGRLFGSVIVGSFQDELPNLPTWSPDFAERFASAAGYDPIPHLAALWEELGEAGERFRGDYHRVRGALAEESFFKPLHDWHERHGLLCGVDQQYGAREGRPVASSDIYGDYVRTHRWFSVPGSDHHGDAKIHSSIAHHYDRPRVWIESFHTSGWGGTLEETFDWLLPWIGAGANLYNPHATYYSTRSGWWEWAPPATDWRQPYWRHNEHFARAVARLCSALTWGHHSCDIGVLFPAATARAALRLVGAGEAGRRAEELYMDVIGQMKWYDVRPGALNRLARDFDVLDDDTVASASVGAAELRTAHEAYGAVILPGCEVLEVDTARRLIEFVDAGGSLIAVGPLPARAAGIGRDDTVVAELAARFASGAARRVATPEEIGEALAAVPSEVQAPVPTLLRRDGEAAVLFVPAVYPRSTEVDVASDDPDDLHSWTGGVSYRFDPAANARSMELVVAGVTGEPELWEPFSGVRRRVEAEPVEDGVRVRVTFEDGPCALLVWGSGDDGAAPAAPTSATFDREIPLEGAWEVQVEATLEDEWGDLAAPVGVTTVETWELEHRSEEASAWSPIHATFGPRASWAGPAPEDDLPAPFADMPASNVAEWSLSRGIHKDPMHVPDLGPSGRVPEEFLDFGGVAAGQAVHLRAVIHVDHTLSTFLAVGAAAAKRAWLDGRPVPLDGSGYLVSGPVELQAGATVLDLRLSAGEDVDALRAHFAFVADIGGYARPEWMRAAGPVAKSSVITFSTRVSLPAEPTGAEVLVGANGPCRMLVDGTEVGRQGGFDPYAERDVDRLQPYDLAEHLHAGEHELRLELLELGRNRPAALLDGLIRTEAGTVAVRSGADWTASSDGAATPIELRLDQRGDPAYNHAWRRPHPLPGGAWLEPGRSTADAGAPVTVTADLSTETRRLRLTTPPGTTEIRIPLAAGCRATVEVGGRPLAVSDAPEGGIRCELDGRRPEICEIVVEPASGLAGGGLLTGPVAFTVGAGEMDLVDWQEAGLPNHSGAVRYRRRLERLQGEAILLDLGEVRGTAEVLLDGESAGIRVCSPYTFDLSGRVGPGGAALEILVLNTLGPHLDAVSPTPYVFPGQRRSGLFGPVRLLTRSYESRHLANCARSASSGASVRQHAAPDGRGRPSATRRSPMADMRYRQLGDSQLQVSEISLGSWLTYSGGVGREQTQACTRAAFDAGITFFDTANVYGRGAAEEVWGEILADHDRDSYVLATKVYFPMSDLDRGLSAAQIHKQIDASLQRLRTDFVDLYQCHRYDTETPLEETVQALSDVVRAGKARYWGFSEWTAEQIEAALTIAREQGLEKPVSSQPQYSLLWRRIEDNGVLRVSEGNGISQIVWSPLAQGVLTGKYQPGEPPPEGTRAASEEMGGFISGFFRDDVLEAVQRLKPIAEQAGLSPAQLALGWILRQPNVASAIIGATRPEQVSENAAAAAVELGDDVLQAIDEALGDAARLGEEQD